MANEVTIKINDTYEIYIDGNKDHEAREFQKVYINPKTEQEQKLYRTIGHFSNIVNALQAISKDFAIQKASKKEIISIDEYVAIVRESNEYMMDIVRGKFPEILN